MPEPLDSCLCCGSEAMYPFADFGEQPLANDFLPPGTACPRYPLAASVCSCCFHSQLTVLVDRSALFLSYPYVSGTTRTLDNYFKWFAEHATERHGGPGRVLDIGCNDGSQLVHFARLGWETAGVDPAENIRLKPEALARLYRGFWAADAIRHFPGPFDAIVAQNVLAHVPDPADFLTLCRQVLAPGGRIYVQTSQADMIEKGEFDTIYHEHVSFFSCRSLCVLARRCGLEAANARKTRIHGESYLFELRVGLDKVSDSARKGHAELATLMASEQAAGRYSLSTYQLFSHAVKTLARSVRDSVEQHCRAGFRVVGYGAAAKANTFVNFSGLQLELIVDDNELKQGLVTPGSGVPVCSPSALLDLPDRLLVVALAWNFRDEIRERLRSLRRGRGDLLLYYFPALEIQTVDEETQ